MIHSGSCTILHLFICISVSVGVVLVTSLYSNYDCPCDCVDIYKCMCIDIFICNQVCDVNMHIYIWISLYYFPSRIECCNYWVLFDITNSICGDFIMPDYM